MFNLEGLDRLLYKFQRETHREREREREREAEREGLDRFLYKFHFHVISNDYVYLYSSNKKTFHSVLLCIHITHFGHKRTKS